MPFQQDAFQHDAFQVQVPDAGGAEPDVIVGDLHRIELGIVAATAAGLGGVIQE